MGSKVYKSSQYDIGPSIFKVAKKAKKLHIARENDIRICIIAWNYVY